MIPTFDESLPDDMMDVARKRCALASTSYVIFFTPRSGSSWLTDICEATGYLSRPDECFNPSFMPQMTRALGARNMDEYVEVLRRRRNTHGVYGCQITYHQLKATFGNEERFLGYFQDAKPFWLIRKDIVSQAISLAKMVATSVSHSAHASEEQIKKSDEEFAYSAPEIKKWLNHILAAERQSEAMFERHGLHPVRMSYEGLTAIGAEGAVRAIAGELGTTLPDQLNLPTRHRKISTKKNDDFAARFREDEKEFLEAVNEERARWTDG